MNRIELIEALKAEKDINKARFLLLEETVKHYNSNNRCTDILGITSYCPDTQNIRHKSEGCGIGRLLDSELAKYIDTNINGYTAIMRDKVFSLMPDFIQILGKSFLQSIQNLHDSEENWDNNGFRTDKTYLIEDIKREYIINNYEKERN